MKVHSSGLEATSSSHSASVVAGQLTAFGSQVTTAAEPSRRAATARIRFIAPPHLLGKHRTLVRDRKPTRGAGTRPGPMAPSTPEVPCPGSNRGALRSGCGFQPPPNFPVPQGSLASAHSCAQEAGPKPECVGRRNEREDRGTIGGRARVESAAGEMIPRAAGPCRGFPADPPVSSSSPRLPFPLATERFRGGARTLGPKDMSRASESGRQGTRFGCGSETPGRFGPALRFVSDAGAKHGGRGRVDVNPARRRTERV